jgi:NADPH:quinone reductase-like Zn-dependent oxidoreductase
MSMKAFILPDFGEAPALADLPEPTPGDGEVLVRVSASAVNPVDNAIAGGVLGGMVEHEFPVVLGRDYAGVVEQVGAGVTRYAPGDAVFGFLRHAEPIVHDGTWAELIVLPEETRVARSAGDGPGRTNVMADNSTDNLTRLAGLLADGVTVPIQRTFELAQAADGLQALAAEHSQGKTAIRIA